MHIYKSLEIPVLIIWSVVSREGKQELAWNSPRFYGYHYSTERHGTAHLIKHIQQIERIQWRAAKYILNDYTSDYKSRLLMLHILPFMYTLDLNDIMFFIKNLNNRHDGFDIKSYISFVTGNTRLATSNKLQHNRSTDMMANNFYFNRLPRLWNALPIIDINLHPDNIKQKLLHYFGNHFEATFDSSNTCNLSFQCCCSKCNNQPTTTNFNILN